MKEGVYFDKKRGQWRAQKKYDGRRKHLGWFSSKEMAQAVYDRENITDYTRVPFNVALARVISQLKNTRDQVDRAISTLETLKCGMTPAWPIHGTPRPMTGFFNTLSDEEKATVLASK